MTPEKRADRNRRIDAVADHCDEPGWVFIERKLLHALIEEEVAASALREESERGDKWRPIETLPPTEWGKTVRVHVWSPQLGICTAEAGNFQGHIHVSVSAFHGNAVEHWGVTHWKPVGSSPSPSEPR